MGHISNLAEVGPAEVGPVEVGPAEVGPVEVGPAEVGPVEVGPAEFQQYDIKPEWAGFPDEPLAETPVEPRRKLRDQTVERAEELVNDWFKSGFWVTDFLERQTIGRAVGHLVRSRLNALLELDL